MTPQEKVLGVLFAAATLLASLAVAENLAACGAKAAFPSAEGAILLGLALGQVAVAAAWLARSRLRFSGRLLVLAPAVAFWAWMLSVALAADLQTTLPTAAILAGGAALLAELVAAARRGLTTAAPRQWQLGQLFSLTTITAAACWATGWLGGPDAWHPSALAVLAAIVGPLVLALAPAFAIAAQRGCESPAGEPLPMTARPLAMLWPGLAAAATTAILSPLAWRPDGAALVMAAWVAGGYVAVAAAAEWAAASARSASPQAQLASNDRRQTA